jgi:predicted acylesterase/phospholipase RssA
MQRRIGVAISGGGYRAAAWGLGALLYLTDAGLHGQIGTVSSVSGGSITNAGLGLKSLEKMSPEDLWNYSAGLAPTLAGNVKAFLAVLLVQVVAWGTAVVGAATHQPELAAGALVVSVLLSLLLAPICEDATFASRMMWLYLDILAASLALFAFALGEGWWWVAALVLVAVLLQFRGVVVGWAIGSALLRTGSDRTRLSDLSSDIDHVLCACDLHGRHHVYFGRDFVYSYGLGLGARPRLALSAAVQASANLPGAFAPRPMLAAPFRFTEGRYRSPVLALTDGGVYDNMADEWLLSFAERTASFRDRVERIVDPELRAQLQAASERLEARAPNFFVIANASGPLGFRFAWTTFVPLFGELAGLLRVKSILYDNGHTTRRRMIVDEFIDRDLAGILVHISTDPWDVVRDGLNTRDPGVRARAEGVAAVLWATPGLDPKTTETPAGAGTVLYPIRRGLMANLLQRSYAIACVQAHIWHDLPLVDIPPLAWFEALEQGRVDDRPKPPEAPYVEPSDELGFAPAQTIPVSLDAVRDLDGVDMARVTYFVIGSEVPEPTWQLRPARASEYSIEVLGLTGVICGPGLRSPMFRNAEEIAGLFQEVEASAGLSIEIEDLWIPMAWLSRGHEPERGDVFRLRLPLFQAAYRFRIEDISQQEFVQTGEWTGSVSYSAEETGAFRAWAQGRIDDAVAAFPKDPELKLAYTPERT